MFRLLGIRLGLALGVVVLGASIGTASGAVVSGSDLSQAPDTSYCATFLIPTTCTVAISGLPAGRQAAGGARAAISGVIVGWSVRSSGSVSAIPIRLRVIHGTTATGLGPQEQLPSAAGIHSFAARVPVEAGDEIGFDAEILPFGSVPVINSMEIGGFLDLWQPALGEGETRDPSQDETAMYEVLLNATIEPDADGDGFGDETQDRCASDVTTQGACPPRPPAPPASSTPATAPETILGKRPAGTIHARRITFRFNASVAGSSFQCKLDRKPFKACRSPKTYKGLAEGKHTFKVRAVGPTGLVDPTPGKRAFKVEL